ncbi:YigZ family protein [Blastococcus sp. Marseille-P5729]|uniref:IMPACT family protein n=1 Tax=Blastococcus sp. Marseille-P5729 TaxID=2086582 RepID=UPI000D10FD78|nr:YigZ family protein [Blastococcus sp. Marseille-P5729]
MPEEYLTVVRDADAEIEVKRSRFLARVRRVDDEDSARAVIEQCRKEYWDARHHCSAFVLGSSSELSRSNDDGEPSGTAGAPILAAITGRGLSDVVVVVTRYFGGTLLGAGGLVRAYTDAAAAGLHDAGVLRRTHALLVEVRVALADVGKLENALRATGLDVRDVDYSIGTTALIRGALTPADEDAVRAQLASLTGGAAELRVVGETWRDHL